MASGIYNRAKYNMMAGVTNLSTDTIKCALMTGSHSFTATHNTWSDVSANETSGTGYSSGGATLASKTVTQAATTAWDAADTTWPSSTITASHVVLYDTTASSNLICSIDFGGAVSTAGGTFTIQWHSSGIITLT